MSDKMLDIHLEKRIGALNLRLSEAWPSAGVTALFGPSGSGKTSVLRLIAGFVKPDRGRITFGEDVWCDTERGIFRPPHKRSTGFVHQGGHLLPHLSVENNLHFAERYAHKTNTTRPDNTPTPREILDELHLSALAHRKPESLSGGERQRVALAQAVLAQPKLLLLDEPFSALDMGRKAELLSYLDRLQHISPVPIIYVSHDVAEVSRIANRVAVIKAGRIVETGETVSVLNRHGFHVSGPQRSGTLLEGTVSELGGTTELMAINIGPQRLKLPFDASFDVGDSLRVIIQANDVVIATQAPIGLSVQNALEGKILAIEDVDGTAMAHIMIGLNGTAGSPLAARITRAAVASLSLAPGQDIYALIKTAVLAR
ncbi:MAG: molybdenum ABC transporter ATP-binding protein [Hyphomonadaceae bacterium]